ncbi:MAG: hypothetical protein FWG87_11170 [Defluviitaleaceae bacterium]|nr:hypothetical protein [Defluviitaleaceae bacterium]
MKTPPTLALLLLIAISLSSCLTYDNPNEHPTPPTALEYSTPAALSTPEQTHPPYTISIEEISNSILTANNDILAEIWFELPTLSGDSEGISKINAFYKQWCEEWLNGENYQDIKELTDELMANGVDEYLAAPELFTHVIGSTVMRSDDTLSIAHTSRWYGGGSPSHSIYGNTFDIRTGELLECPYDITDVAFREQLQALAPHISFWDNNGGYFRDAEHIYIITRTYRGDIIQWNGKKGEDFSAEVWGIFP